MANKYTDMELVLFHDEAPDTLHLNSLKAHFIGHEQWDSDKIERALSKHIKTHNAITTEYRVFLARAYTLIFETPWEDMALYINGYPDYNRIEMDYIIKWRLKIGK